MLSSAGQPLPGTVNLSSTGTTYVHPRESAGGEHDLHGDGRWVHRSSGKCCGALHQHFHDGTSGVANTTTPAVVSVSPANQASAVAVSSPIVLTFNEAIDATTVNDATVPISVSGVSGVLAGTYGWMERGR